uniref:Uncharacterized protein n=1 Tax=Spongospora subterranea TaxID=70186 RepID=A0A0H5QHL2_9EUKA|eukprot:CRZ01147.1 hypothetical protein [Spongospora subterranea]
MLRNLIIVSSSGIVLYSKDFTSVLSQPRLLGGLITAMLKASVIRTGFPVSLIELKSIAVAVQSDTKCKVSCSLFYDKSDGPAFGRLLALEILSAFVQQYSSQLVQISANLKDFSGFNNKIGDAIRSSIRPALDMLTSVHGIQTALIISGDTLLYSTHEVDKVGVVANLDALFGIASDIMSAQHDLPVHMSFHNQNSRIVLLSVDRSILVVSCKAAIDARKLDYEINKTALLLQKLLVLNSNLQDSWSFL